MTADHKTKLKRLGVVERRATIERAAARLFARRGYEGTTIAAIAAEIGVTKPIIYRHFESKRDLYLALLDGHERRLAEFPAASADELGREEVVVALLEGWFSYAAESRHVWRMMFEDRGGGAAVERRRLQIRTRARAVLAQLIGSARPGLDPALALVRAEQLRSGLVGLTLWWFDEPGLNREQVVEAASEAVLPALGAAPTDS